MRDIYNGKSPEEFAADVFNGMRRETRKALEEDIQSLRDDPRFADLEEDRDLPLVWEDEQ
jgi:hypothetical protein